MAVSAREIKKSASESQQHKSIGQVSTYAIVIVVRPEVTLSKASWICLSVCESREAVASSSSRIRESLRMARAMAIYEEDRVSIE